MIRVAAIHLERNSPDTDLDACLHQLEIAVTTHAPAIVVCPELALSSPEGEEQSSLGRARERFADVARRHQVFIAVSLSCQQTELRTWLTPEGEPPSQSVEESLLVIESPYGRLGLCAGVSLFESEAVRRTAGAGVSLIAAPLSLCHAPKTALHAPARASENALFVAVATLFEQRAPAQDADFDLEQPRESARGSVSQIVGPNGRTLSIATVDHAGVAIAEVDLPRAEVASVHARRPELYRGSGGRARRRGSRQLARAVRVAVVELAAPETHDEVDAVIAACTELARAEVLALASEGTALIVLPALLGAKLPSHSEAERWADSFANVARAIAEALAETASHVVTSLVERVDGDLTQVGVVLGAAGVVARQRQLHVPMEGWITAGRRLETVPLPWGTLAIAVGADALVPELLAAQRASGADLIAAVLSEDERRATLFSLPALADELEVPIVAAVGAAGEDRPPSASLIVDPRAWPALRSRTGELRLHAEVTLAVDDPSVRDGGELAAI